MMSVVLAGCSQAPRTPDLGVIYNEAAQNVGDDRNPVIVIPGVLGTKLESSETEKPVWGAFIYGAADADTAEGARLVALPMEQGRSLWDLRDEVTPTEVLDTLTLDIGLIRGVELGAYVDILKTLAVGKYRDETLGQSGFIDYGGLHYTCFQFPYDWRRDVSEQAAELHELILTAIDYQPESGKRVDVIAHSMGGMVLRYYLRYGPQPLPEDGSLPELTWEGARHVDSAILIGTPSAGSVLALKQLVEGVNFASFITPTYRPAVLGTMPSLYQLMTRTRHNRVVDATSGEAIDVFDPDVWVRYEWGLADPDQDRVLRQLLPDVATREERRAIALDHLTKSLRRAEQFQRAIDAPASPPPGTEMHLVAGDAIPTPDVLEVSESGRLRVREHGPGDDTVTRASALMDERQGTGYQPRLRSPARFSTVYFLTSNHMGLTKDPVFANYMLYTLLERPRDPAMADDGGDR